MSEPRSREELLKFLDYVRAKGLMSPNTVESRKASVNKVLGILGEDEAADVTVLDLDHLMNRFNNLHGKQYTPGSLRSYRSRVKSAIDDFTRYLDNPLAFKPGTAKRERKPEGVRKSPHRVHVLKAEEFSTSAPTIDRPSLVPTASLNILPIPLRPDLVVRIQGLPFDLTEAEAKKIAGVVQAMAVPTT